MNIIKKITSEKSNFFGIIFYNEYNHLVGLITDNEDMSKTTHSIVITDEPINVIEEFIIENIKMLENN
jgi:hypothetical protein